MLWYRSTTESQYSNTIALLTSLYYSATVLQHDDDMTISYYKIIRSSIIVLYDHIPISMHYLDIMV